MLQPRIRIGERTIGEGQPHLFLPDIGTFFNQDVQRGLALIDGVAAAGLKVIKGEVLHDASICLESSLLENITTRDAQVSKEPYRDVIARKVLPLPAYAKLFAHARSQGLELVLSVYDATGLAFALDQGAVMIKIASSNIVHRRLIEKVAQAKVPALLDTGGATLDEVSRAVGWFLEAGGSALVVEHSPPAPPNPVERHNLRKLHIYRDTFTCPVGLSDHHAGTEMLLAAIALGASVVEKGVFPDDLQRDQDVAHGLRISRLADTVRQCANIELAMRPPAADAPPPAGHPARMGLVAARALKAGEVLSDNDVSFAFPAIGVPVEQVNDAIGRRVAVEVPRGAPIEWSMLGEIPS